jgi:hypothetical protein
MRREKTDPTRRTIQEKERFEVRILQKALTDYKTILLIPLAKSHGDK